MMDTTLSIEEVEFAIASSELFDLRRNLVIPNVSWGFLTHEADLLVMTKHGYLTEIEIKRSFADFKADFKKKVQHRDCKVSKLYYAVPKGIVNKCKPLLEDVKCGLIYYTEDKEVVPVWDSPFTTPIRYKLALEEKLKLAELGCMRVWRLKEKLAMKGGDK
jgi:hypothetical protein